ncbi:SRPBCC family protein [Aeromicrobium chenweiae]|uniref:SRPBCC family protein n=1 Tax=Aeromicrobium chenweiae TaxID=2079793 RepID=A0A2S0WK16_9ACTN|nr:SRPBCC family protein [Aeromicrobium chenweiae]AWB91683.1 SRPBCC family protein [Aeromicrobium chenweiae]TGN32523.1 SRPBCC family protein [Aeromicrobium chenweiae]
MGQPPLEASIVIAAPPSAVWAALSDLRAMKDRSPEVIRTWLLGRPGVGRRAVNLNRRGAVVWPTWSRITRWKDPVQDYGRGALAFRVMPTDVEWSYELEPTDGGTEVTERRSALVDPSLVVRLTARFLLGGADRHDTELLAGMHRTLETLRSDLER